MEPRAKNEVVVALALTASVSIGAVALTSLGEERAEGRAMAIRPGLREPGGRGDMDARLVVGRRGSDEAERPSPASAAYPRAQRSTSAHRDDIPEPIGRSAGLSGRLTRGEKALGPAMLEIVAGENRGRTIAVASDGTFGIEQLFPGYARVTLAGSAPRVVRDVALRPGLETRLELDLEAGFEVVGRLVDPEENALVDVAVNVDGSWTRSDGLGRFVARTAASGRAFASVRAEGFAATRVELVPPSSGSLRELDLVLAPACRLEVEVRSPRGSIQDGRVLILPSAAIRGALGTGRAAYPWADLPALEVHDGLAVLDDLPPGEVDVVALLAQSEGRARSVRLRPGAATRVVILTKELPTQRFRITRNGRPWSDASVELIARDCFRARAIALGEYASSLFTRASIDLDVARRRAVTDASGTVDFARRDAGRPGLLVVVWDDTGTRRVRELAGISAELGLQL